MSRLGTTAARLKLKGIDGAPHKQRSMRLNSTQREEPYQGLTYREKQQRCCVRKGRFTGAAWLSSARVVRCWVKSRNERNPRRQLQVSGGTATFSVEEGGDDVKSSWPLCPGLHTCYNGAYKGKLDRKVTQIPKKVPQFGLQSATRLHEAGIDSNRR